MTVDIPAPAKLVCTASGVRFEPQDIPAGRSSVRVFVSGSGSASLVYSEVLLVSQFRRRIYLSGRFSANAPAVKERLIYEAPQIARNAPLTAAVPAMAVNPEPADVISDVGAVPLSDEQLLELRKGQRVPAAGYLSGTVEVYLTGQRLGNADIDPYVFLLDENEKCRGEGDLVFFGNERSQDGAVRYYPDDGHISIDLAKLPPEVQRISVAYSVYSGDSVKNFSQVREPEGGAVFPGKGTREVRHTGANERNNHHRDGILHIPGRVADIRSRRGIPRRAGEALQPLRYTGKHIKDPKLRHGFSGTHFTH